MHLPAEVEHFQTPAGPPEPVGLQLIVPKWPKLPNSFERELRTGGLLHARLERERAQTKQRMERACLPHKTYERRPGSEWNLQAVVDSRTWMRWYLTDPYFWNDPKNIKRFVKDNPIAAPWKT